MKYVFASLLLFSIQTFADSNAHPSYFDECANVAVQKLSLQAAELNSVLNIDTVELETIDNRWYLPSHYLWFTAVGYTRAGRAVELRTMTQKPRLPPGQCF